jgi:putative pyoverdin transport system ATP-binding/permease protein
MRAPVTLSPASSWRARYSWKTVSSRPRRCRREGQRKRLALLISLREDRPIYVFDEWAADQDAHFRDIFYTVLVPELRRRGKGVIVISHDDRYYRLGDRTLRLTYGQMSP